LVTTDEEVATFASELSDYNDAIAQPDDQPAVAGLLDHARSFKDGYKRLVLSRVRSDSNCVRALQALEPALDVNKVFLVRASTQFIRLPPTYEEYLRTRSRNFRKSLRRARRGAENQRFAIRELEPDNFSPNQLAESFLSLNLDRWGAESYYELPFPNSFVLKLVPELFRERRLRAFALLKDDSLLGLELCMVGANSLCAWNGGFLSEAARWSPGNLLIEAGIRSAQAMKLEEYDLLRGDESYKASWANSTRDLGWLEFDTAG
jgi:CelD/BcsL family acetyltransferase involved in cellulose biosynthesis